MENKEEKEEVDSDKKEKGPSVDSVEEGGQNEEEYVYQMSDAEKKMEIMLAISRELNKPQYGDVSWWIVPKLELEEVLTFEEFDILRRHMAGTHQSARLDMLFRLFLSQKERCVLERIPGILRGRCMEEAADVVASHFANLPASDPTPTSSIRSPSNDARSVATASAPIKETPIKEEKEEEEEEEEKPAKKGDEETHVIEIKFQR